MSRADFMELYNHIARYYPLGISESDERYGDYDGIKLLKSKIELEKSDSKRSQWSLFLSRVRTEVAKNRAVYCETRVMDTSNTGKIVISTEKSNVFSHSQELWFHLSYLGPFYCIYGRDSITKSFNSQHKLEFDPIISVSPIGVYTEYFEQLKFLIENVFNFKYVKYHFLSYRIEGLSTLCASDGLNMDSMFQALFSAESIPKYKIAGDPLYK